MLKFDQKGLIPAIVQDNTSGEVLMMAWMNAESVRRTLASGQAWFYSRSRQELWHKGATSGSFLNVKSIWKDCDEDTLILKVDAQGPACHTGNRTCFFTEMGHSADKEIGETAAPAEGAAIVDELFAVIEERKKTKPEGSYVGKLLDGGIDRIGKKVVEEAAESIIAAKNGERGPIAYEVADLWFHSLVLLAASGLTPNDVWQELRRRRK